MADGDLVTSECRPRRLNEKAAREEGLLQAAAKGGVEKNTLTR